MMTTQCAKCGLKFVIPRIGDVLCDKCQRLTGSHKNDLGTELVEYAIIFGAVLLLSVSMSTFVSSCGKAFAKSQTQHYSCWTPNEPGSVNPCRTD